MSTPRGFRDRADDSLFTLLGEIPELVKNLVMAEIDSAKAWAKSAGKQAGLGGVWFIVALFFPWNLTDFVAISCCPYLAAAANAAFFLFKLFVVLFFSVTLVRISVARFRITQVVDVYWKILGALSLVGLILVMVDAHVR